jgi:ribonuclease HII
MSIKQRKRKPRFLAGVDEAGRGPLAGPVSVGVAVIPHNFDWNRIPHVNDSKKLSEKKREEIYELARALKRTGELTYTVSLVSGVVIDRIGITKAVALGIERCFKKLSLDPRITHVKLDGLLKAPGAFEYQETIIKGDSKEKVIGLASIMAKVTRDRMMVRKARLFPEYSFEIHKGYGTKLHLDAINRHGLSWMHRTSFCKNALRGRV